MCFIFAHFIITRSISLTQKRSAETRQSVFMPLEGTLRDGDLELVLKKTIARNPEKHHVPCYVFLMLAGSQKRVAGVLTFRIGDAASELYYPEHIGYRVRKQYRGQGFAERSLRLVGPFVRKHGYRELWISCRPENQASRISCERNGGILQETVPAPHTHEMYRQGYRSICRYMIKL
ncbi:MAG TPA: GNAT family N-acetyltransferase [Prosthecochloris aestuarii]|uniref:GNAT family N-acetyltransferase n=1 Tax=Prosthecochloris aestuarii TaxID=1102 RepID=A0A831SRY4_PROAE|nr:GNAT family N-acetyltransferase [Prosthecochloris aestuarii]